MDTQKQIETVNKQIDQLMLKFAEEQIPPPPFYRLGEAEFMFRCVQLVQTDLIKELLGLDDDEYDLLIKKKWLEQATMMFQNTKRARMEQQAQAVEVPKQKLFLPPGIEL